MGDKNGMNRCVNCGRELPEGAAFCPYCETVQVPKLEVEAPKPRGRRARALALAAAAAAIIAIAVLVLPTTAPAISESAPPAESAGQGSAGQEGPAESPAPESAPPAGKIPASLEYSADGREYSLRLTFDGGKGERPSISSVEHAVPEGYRYANPSQLYVYDAEGNNALEEFSALLESCSVRTVPRDGGYAMDCTAPKYDPSFPYAALTSHIDYWAGCGTNDILWTLNLKSGETLQLCQSITVREQKLVAFRPEDTPMDTLEDLQALMTYIDTEVDVDTAVQVYLPARVYEGGLNLPAMRGLSLYGSDDGETRTTFTGPFTVRSANKQLTEIVGVDFIGSGGTGITAKDGLHLTGCTLSGWDVAVLALDGAWVGANGSTFEDNGVALSFNSNLSDHYSNPSYNSNRFLNNGKAIVIDNLPGDEVLRFPDSLFHGNGVDIENNAGHSVDLSGAIFE